tara:strand:+ start:281 stop:1858 length:1578 start_codon:yes stop_codon:yes gene_type:complete
MTSEKLLTEIQNLKINEFINLSDKFDNSISVQEILYSYNVKIFESSKINHKERLTLLKKVKQLSEKYKNKFSVAYNLTLTIKVLKELGDNKDLIAMSHNAIELWKKILNKDKLAVNGLIFAYIDLGLIYSEYNLYSLSLKYLNKANSLLIECTDDYNPFKKLYVAYANVYSKIGDSKKAISFYNQVIKRIENKKDHMTLIPILINKTNILINEKKSYKSIHEKCLKALKISEKNSDNIYRPYIYEILGFLSRKYEKNKQSINYYLLSIDFFKNIKVLRKIPQIEYELGKLYYKSKDFKNSELCLKSAAEKNKDFNNYSLDIEIFKFLCQMYKKKNDVGNLFISKGLLSKALEQENEYSRNILTKVNKEAIGFLSDEYKRELDDRDDLKLKIDMSSKKRYETSKILRSISEREFLKKIINDLSKDKLKNIKLIQLCKERFNKTKEWNVFMQSFNEINPDFTKYIIKKTSNITESELRVCNLIKMNFSTSDIAEILSISIRGVEQHRYRIRKKLKVNTDLSIFIQSL